MENSIKSFVDGINEGQRTIRVLASDATLDRSDERILPSAWQLDNFKKNPVILAAHSHALDDGKSPVIGQAIKVWTDRKGLWCTIQFAETELGEEYWSLYKSKAMRAVSVGFSPLKTERRTEDDGRQSRVIVLAELYEISCVAVPCNPAALVKTHKDKRKAFIDDKMSKRNELKEVLAGAKRVLAEAKNEHERADIQRDIDFLTDPELQKKHADEFAELIFADSAFGMKNCKPEKTFKSIQDEPDYSRHFCRL
jgi:HK97 family phage prohead protease